MTRADESEIEGNVYEDRRTNSKIGGCYNISAANCDANLPDPSCIFGQLFQAPQNCPEQKLLHHNFFPPPPSSQRQNVEDLQIYVKL